MSDHDKMMAFGTWLTSRKLAVQAELYALGINYRTPVDALRVKAGHLEATMHILQAFTELYNGELNKFLEDYVGQTPEQKEEDTPDE